MITEYKKNSFCPVSFFYNTLSHFLFASHSKNKITTDYLCVKLELSLTENLSLIIELCNTCIIKMNSSHIGRKQVFQSPY